MYIVYVNCYRGILFARKEFSYRGVMCRRQFFIYDVIIGANWSKFFFLHHVHVNIFMKTVWIIYKIIYTYLYTLILKKEALRISLLILCT